MLTTILIHAGRERTDYRTLGNESEGIDTVIRKPGDDFPVVDGDSGRETSLFHSSCIAVEQH